MINQPVSCSSLHCCPYASVNDNNRITKWKIFTPGTLSLLALELISFSAGTYVLATAGDDPDSQHVDLGGAFLTGFGGVGTLVHGVLITRVFWKARRLEAQVQAIENANHENIQHTPLISISIDQNQNPIETVPNDIWYQIFDYLSLQDLNQASLVCRKWYNLTSHPFLWKKFASLKGIPDNEEKYQGKAGYLIYLDEKKITQINKEIVEKMNMAAYIFKFWNGWSITS